MNQRKIIYPIQNAIPNGEGLTALPVSLNTYTHNVILREHSDRHLHRTQVQVRIPPLAAGTLPFVQGDIER